jgi:hypothetical protein
LEVGEGEETFLCPVDGFFLEIGGTGDAGVTTGTPGGATVAGVIGTLRGAKQMGSFGSGTGSTGSTVGCGVAGAGGGGATAARPRTLATFAGVENRRANRERCSRWRSSGQF